MQFGSKFLCVGIAVMDNRKVIAMARYWNLSTMKRQFVHEMNLYSPSHETSSDGAKRISSLSNRWEQHIRHHDDDMRNHLFLSTP